MQFCKDTRFEAYLINLDVGRFLFQQRFFSFYENVYYSGASIQPTSIQRSRRYKELFFHPNNGKMYCNMKQDLDIS